MKKFLLFFLIFLLSFIYGCLNLPDDVIMPEWNVDLNIPVINKYYTLDEIIGKQNNLSVDPTTNLFIVTSDTFKQASNLLDFIKSDQEFTSLDNNMSPENGTRDAFIEFRSDNVEIDSAVFSKGYIQINVQNNSSVSVYFKAYAPGIVKDGTPLILETNLEPHKGINIYKDLNGYSYKIPPEQLALPPFFWKQFWIKSISSSTGQPVSGEKVNFDVSISDFYFSKVSGKFSETQIGRKRTSFAFAKSSEIESYKDKLFLKEANLKLKTIYNPFYNNQFSLKIDSINIMGIKGNQRIYLRDSLGSQLLNLFVQEGSNTIDFNENNSNIKDFLTFLPDSIIIDGSYKILGQNTNGTVTNIDQIEFQTLFSTKSQLAIRKTNITDTMNVNIDANQRQDIQRGKYAKLNFEVENALPFNVIVKVIMLDSLFNPLFTLTKLNGQDSIEFSSSVIDQNTGETISPSSNKFFIYLNEDEIKLFSKAYYASLSAVIETEGANQIIPPVVSIKASDWIKMKAYGLINYNVKID
ncbi:MAG TPA: hypothetical protein VFF33_14225 [Ignavibacteriaceae bacterium]|nr:hypothetical protein [Ignavibacteriaceae bacterium]